MIIDPSRAAGIPVFCPILQGETEDPIITKCRHIFDREALKDCFIYGYHSCPLCQRELKASDILSLRERITGKIKLRVTRVKEGVVAYIFEIYDEITSKKYLTFPIVYLSLIPTAVISAIKIQNIKDGISQDLEGPFSFLAVETTAGMTSIFAQMFNGFVRMNLMNDRSHSLRFKRYCRILIDLGQISLTFGNPLLAIGHYTDDQEIQMASSVMVAGGSLVSVAASGVYAVKDEWDTRSSFINFVIRTGSLSVLFGAICFLVYCIWMTSLYEIQKH
ncbi:MAG: hypothetical protein K940chlam3_01585 [Chlamydiae bacterium]|nr:hypothetical protein [Chlamydiota bacterium]